MDEWEDRLKERKKPAMTLEHKEQIIPPLDVKDFTPMELISQDEFPLITLPLFDINLKKLPSDLKQLAKQGIRYKSNIFDTEDYRLGTIHIIWYLKEAVKSDGLHMMFEHYKNPYYHLCRLTAWTNYNDFTEDKEKIKEWLQARQTANNGEPNPIQFCFFWPEDLRGMMGVYAVG